MDPRADATRLQAANRLVFGAVADDLTGAVELASILVACGVRTRTLVGQPTGDAPADAEAVVVAVRSRVADPSRATALVEEVGHWLERGEPRQTFFKYCGTFDSTPTGNIGCCTDALLRLRSARRTLFVPSFPENGRTVYSGHLFVGDQLVSNSTKRFDPLTPMDNPDLVAVLRPQTKEKVGLLPRRVTTQGQIAAESYLAERAAQGETYFIADAVDDEDLERLATLTVDWPLMTGGSTIVGHYPALWSAKGWLAGQGGVPGVGVVTGPGAVISGSCSDRTLAQLADFETAGHPVLRIDLRSGSPATILDGVRAWASSRIGDQPVAIATSADVDDLTATQGAIGRERAARMAEQILGQTARMLVDMGVRRLCVAGGETSGAVLDALGVKELNVGPYVPRGIALATTTLPCGTVGLCLKSGRIGADDVFTERLATLPIGGHRG